MIKRKRFYTIAIFAGVMGIVAILTARYVIKNVAMPSSERVQLQSMLMTNPALTKRYREIQGLTVLEDGTQWASGSQGAFGVFQFRVAYQGEKDAKIRVKWAHDNGSLVQIDAIYEVDSLELVKLFPGDSGNQ